MYYEKAAWLLCATILSSQPAAAVERYENGSRQENSLAVAQRGISGETVAATRPTITAGTPVEKSGRAVPAVEGLTLRNAIELAIGSSPRLRSSISASRASQGERVQAGALPNPDISVEAENFSGGGSYKNLDSAEITYGVSQLIEIGGKRAARVAIADKAVSISELEIEIMRLDLIRDVTVAYAEAIAAEEEVKLARQQKDLAAEVFQSVTRRVDAAADPLFQKSKAEVANSNSTIALNKAERDARLAKQKLISLWGGDEGDVQLGTGDFFDLVEPEPLGELSKLIKDSPDYLRSEQQLEQGKAFVELEKANAIPDPSLDVGVRDFRDTGDQAFIVGVSLPIPVFNSNAGNISKARHQALMIESDLQAERIDLTTELLRTWQNLKNAYEESETLRTSILPAAEKSFDLARQGYGVGKFPYIDVLDSQRTLFETREQYIDSLRQYNISRAEVERLTAKNMNQLEENHGK